MREGGGGSGVLDSVDSRSYALTCGCEFDLRSYVMDYFVVVYIVHGCLYWIALH